MAHLHSVSIGELVRIYEQVHPEEKPTTLDSSICYYCKQEGRFVPVNSAAPQEGRTITVTEKAPGGSEETRVYPVCYQHAIRHKVGNVAFSAMP